MMIELYNHLQDENLKELIDRDLTFDLDPEQIPSNPLDTRITKQNFLREIKRLDQVCIKKKVLQQNKSWRENLIRSRKKLSVLFSARLKTYHTF